MVSLRGPACMVTSVGRVLVVLTMTLGLAACGPSHPPPVADKSIEQPAPAPTHISPENSSPSTTETPPQEAVHPATSPDKESSSSPLRYAEEITALTDIFCSESPSSKAIDEEIGERCGIDAQTMANLQTIVRHAFADMLVACPPVFGAPAESVDYTKAFHIVEDMNAAIRALLGRKYPEFVIVFNRAYDEWQARFKEEAQRATEIREHLLQESQGNP